MFTTMVSFLPSSTLIWCNCCSCWPTQHHNLKNLEFVLCVFVYNILLGLIMNFTWEQSLRWFILTRRNLWWSRLIGLQIRCSKLYLLFLFFQRNDMCEEKEGEKKSNFTCFVIVLWAKEERVVLPDAVILPTFWKDRLKEQHEVKTAKTKMTTYGTRWRLLQLAVKGKEAKKVRLQWTDLCV